MLFTPNVARRNLTPQYITGSNEVRGFFSYAYHLTVSDSKEQTILCITPASLKAYRCMSVQFCIVLKVRAWSGILINQQTVFNAARQYI